MSRRCGVPILTYFSCPGLAHYPRMLFKIGNVDFVDRREGLASSYEFEPLLDIGDEVLNHTSAIAMYAARKANLVPDCPVKTAKLVSIQALIADVQIQAARLADKVYAKEAKYRTSFAEKAPECLKQIQLIVDTMEEETSPFMMGKLTFGDVAVTAFYKQLKDFMSRDEFDQLTEPYPRLNAAVKAVNKLPGVKELNSSYHNEKLTLYYFGMDGRATPIRWLCAYGKIEYTDKHFTMDEWKSTYKAMSPTGRAPFMTIEGEETETLAETNAILEYLGSRKGMIPSNPSEAGHMYSVMQSADAVTEMIVSVWHLHKSNQDIAAQVAHLNDGHLAKAVQRLEDQIALKMRRGFIIGDKMSIGDLVVAAMFHLVNGRHHGIVLKDLWTQYPSLLRVYKRVMMHPEIQNSLQCKVARPIYNERDVCPGANSVRIMLMINKIDHLWNTHEDPTYKQITLEAPYMDINGRLYHEIFALIKHAAERADLIPYLIENRIHANSLFSAYNSVLELVMSKFGQADEEQYCNERRAEFDARMDVVEKLAELKASVNGWLVEGHPTWIDFYIAGEIEFAGHQNWIVEKFSKKWPTLFTAFTKVFMLPGSVVTNPQPFYFP